MTNEEKWMQNYNLSVEYKEENGNIDVPPESKFKDVNLDSWLTIQKRRYHEQKLDLEKIKLLEDLGINWTYTSKKEKQLPSILDALIKYKEIFGDLDVPYDYVTEDNIKLGKEVARLNSDYRNNKIKPDVLNQLQEMGMRFGRKKVKDLDINEWIQAVSEYLLVHKRTSPCQKKNNFDSELIWNENYKRLYETYLKYDCDMDLTLQNLDNDTKNYFIKLRYKYKKGILSPSRVKKLNAINYDWGPRDTKLLNKTIGLGSEYNKVYRKIMLERLECILRYLSFEMNGTINSREDQVKIEEEIVKRIWR